jgi:arylsulfatase A-like enzyme
MRTPIHLRTLLFAVLICIAEILHPQDSRPNIIFILTDDQRWDALGYSGNAIIQTPEMDKLAKEGTYFRNAFVTTPICAASRASIMTGVYERRHGYTFQQPPLKEEFIEKSYFSVLKKTGYHTGFLGKFGVAFENQRDMTHFDVYQPEEQQGYYRLTEGGTIHKHLTDIIADNAISFIKNAPEDKPFSLSISFHAPHAVDSSPEQYIWPAAFDTLYKNTTIPPPVLSAHENFERLPIAVQEGFNRARWRWRYDTPDKYQKMVKGYYRMISGIDSAIGQIRHALMEQGISGNTIIILMGDNGYFLGERQIAGKWLMYEPSLRVPLIIYNPLGKGGKTIKDMALNIDIAPTILDFAKAEIPENYQGISLAAYTSNTASYSVKRDHFLCEHLWDFDRIPASEGIRTEKYKYFRYIGAPSTEELYDLESDPNEAHNLVNTDGYTRTLQELRGRCDSLIEKMSN